MEYAQNNPNIYKCSIYYRWAIDSGYTPEQAIKYAKKCIENREKKDTK